MNELILFGFLIILLLFSLSLIIWAIHYVVRNPDKFKDRFIEIHRPEGKITEKRNHDHEKAITSFRELFLDKRKRFCYKIFLTQDKIYIILYHAYIPLSSPMHLDGAILSEFIIFFLRGPIRYLDRRRFEKTNLIEPLLRKSACYYEINRRDVSFDIDYRNVTIKHKGQYVMGKREKFIYHRLNEHLDNGEIRFLYDNIHYNEYNTIINNYFNR